MPEWVANTPWWVVIGLTATIGYAVIRFTRWTGSVDTRLDNLADAIRDGLAEVRADIKKILDRPNPRPAVQSASPLVLTDFGREISAGGSASEWARDHAPNLTVTVEGKEEFEIFDICVEYVERQFADDADFARVVRATAYQHGTDTEQVLKVFQIELRDLVLQAEAQRRR